MDCINILNEYRNWALSIPGKFWLLGLYFQNSIQNFLNPKFNTKQFIRGLSFNFHLRISLMSFSNLKLFGFIHVNTCNEWLTRPNTVPQSTFIKKWIQPDKWHIPSNILGPRSNWQWNQRLPVLVKNSIFLLKNPLKIDLKGVGH